MLVDTTWLLRLAEDDTTQTPVPDPEQVVEDIGQNVIDTDWWIGTALPAAIHIAIIVLVGLVIRNLLNRAVSRGMAALAERHEKKSPQTAEGQIESERQRQRAKTLEKLFHNIIAIVVFSMVALLVLANLGVNLGPLIAGAGIVGVALGFGAQSLVQDFISGIFILMEDQYGVGDIVDVGDATGTVEEVQLRITKIRAVDGTLWFVRNGEIVRVGNLSQDWSRSVLDIDVAYDTDLNLAKQVMIQAGEEFASDPDFADDVLENPEMWGVDNLGADGITVRMILKTTPGSQWRCERALRERIKSSLDDAGIEIPFPQRTVWIRTDTPPEPDPKAVASVSSAPVAEVPLAKDQRPVGDEPDLDMDSDVEQP